MEQLRASLEPPNALALLPICTDGELSAALAATGSKNPDVVVVEAGDSNLLLRPVDLKWSLDVANYQQISAPVLANLLVLVPRLGEAIRDLVAEPARDWPFSPRDGYFFSPRTYANERFLTSSENQRQEYPLESAEARFQEVDPYAFFEVLPGWTTARELARLDGSLRGLGQVDSADRYYHFGAGVAGALAALDQSIFDDEATIEPEGEGARFRAFLSTISPPSTAVVLDRLGARMRQRGELVRRLRDLIRGSFGFRDFVDALVAAGLATPGQAERDLRAQWSDRYRSLVNAADAELRQAGRELRAAGASDPDALEALERERPAFGRRLRSRAQAIIQSLGD